MSRWNREKRTICHISQTWFSQSLFLIRHVARWPTCTRATNLIAFNRRKKEVWEVWKNYFSWSEEALNNIWQGTRMMKVIIYEFKLSKAYHCYTFWDGKWLDEKMKNELRKQFSLSDRPTLPSIRNKISTIAMWGGQEIIYSSRNIFIISINRLLQANSAELDDKWQMHEPKITSDFGKIFHKRYVIGTLLYNFHGQSISSFRGMQLITKNHIFPRSDADNSLLNGAKSLCPTTLLKIKD